MASMSGQNGSVGMALIWPAGIPVEVMNWATASPGGPLPAPR